MKTKCLAALLALSLLGVLGGCGAEEPLAETATVSLWYERSAPLAEVLEQRIESFNAASETVKIAAQSYEEAELDELLGRARPDLLYGEIGARSELPLSDCSDEFTAALPALLPCFDDLDGLYEKRFPLFADVLLLTASGDAATVSSLEEILSGSETLRLDDPAALFAAQLGEDFAYERDGSNAAFAALYNALAECAYEGRLTSGGEGAFGYAWSHSLCEGITPLAPPSWQGEQRSLGRVYGLAVTCPFPDGLAAVAEVLVFLSNDESFVAPALREGYLPAQPFDSDGSALQCALAETGESCLLVEPTAAYAEGDARFNEQFALALDILK